MKKYLAAALASISCISATASELETECARLNRDDPGYNCKVPEDATGRPIFYSERVVGEVIWTAPTRNAYGLYKFTAAYSHFQVEGHSRFKPIVGEPVEIVVRAVLYGGRIVRNK